MSLENLNKYFEKMWIDYCSLNPQAQDVFNCLTQENEKVVNDHIAFRTYNHPNLNIDHLSKHFIKYGYRFVADYTFKEKKLKAKHFAHSNPELPKVFISELDLSQCSDYLNVVVEKISNEFNRSVMDSENFLFSGRPWQASHEVYKKLYEESEYAAWVYAHGYRPNHFTVLINQLKKLNDISQLNLFLKKNGFLLNSSGGEIKGSSADYLEQSSTMANQILVPFNEGSFKIPACYYEFAKRYKLPNGELFQGFVAQSADKIFESTH